MVVSIREDRSVILVREGTHSNQVETCRFASCKCSSLVMFVMSVVLLYPCTTAERALVLSQKKTTCRFWRNLEPRVRTEQSIDSSSSWLMILKFDLKHLRWSSLRSRKRWPSMKKAMPKAHNFCVPWRVCVDDNLVSKGFGKIEDKRWKYGEDGFEEGRHFWHYSRPALALPPESRWRWSDARMRAPVNEGWIAVRPHSRKQLCTLTIFPIF